MRSFFLSCLLLSLMSFSSSDPISQKFAFEAFTFKGNDEPLEWSSEYVFCVVIDWDGKEGISILSNGYVEQYSTTSVERNEKDTTYQAKDKNGKSGYVIGFTNDLSVVYITEPAGIMRVLSNIKF